jgi:hypothetical protein
MAVKRRNLEIFSLSFLDCICCGFGAIILLFVLSKAAEPQVIESSRIDASALIARLEEELNEIRGETSVLNRDLAAQKEQVAEVQQLVARLQGDLSNLEGEFAASTQHADVQNTVEGTLAETLQTLTEEMKRLLASSPRRRTAESPIGGIPVDSEYIIFIIDTSGSMQQFAWPLVQKKMREVLEIYPEVKGIQVMNDMGRLMFTQYQGRWIPDSPARREAILNTLRTWTGFSNSSPAEGIDAAIRSFYAQDKKISLYVFGDEFSGDRMQPIVDVVDRLNRADESGRRRVRIHAIGFPVMFQPEVRRFGSNTGDRFASLMRVLCERNGGAFVGLNSVRP